MGDRLMVGHLPLAQGIGVRVPVPQLAKVTTPMRMHWGFSFALWEGTRKTERSERFPRSASRGRTHLVFYERSEYNA